MERELIELVRKYPALYDTNDLNYAKSKYKSEIWDSIGVKLKTNGEEVKAEWTKLRNRHRDALRRQKRMRRSGAAATQIKPWKLQSQMAFLCRYMVSENRETNFSSNDDNHSEQKYQPAETDIEHLDDETIFAEENEQLGQSSIANLQGEESLGSPASSEYSNESPMLKKNPKKKLKKIDIDNLIQKTFDQHEQRAKERAEERKKLEEKIPPKDDLHSFFILMYEITKKMPPSSQHVVRRNVFLAVTEEEARLLNISESIME